MLISIIIPVYNAEDHILTCIESSFSQNYKNIEVICIDNNSTDNSLQILEQAKKLYPQLIVLEEKRPGACAARNKGLSVAGGEWIQFLDADDKILNSKLAHQAKLIRNSAPLIAAASITMNRNETKSMLHVYPRKNVWVSLAKVQLGNTCSNLFSRKWLLKVGGWDDNLKSSQEYDLMFRILKQNQQVIYDNVPLTIINQSTNSITRHPANIVGNIKRRAILLDKIAKHTHKLKIKELHQREINQALFDVIREMYLYDANQANKMYYQYFNGTYKPIQSTGTSKNYLYLHNLLGFNTSNFLITLVKNKRNNNT